MKPILFIAICCSIACIACRKNALTLSPAKSIEGTYTAYKYEGAELNFDYPINGKTIALQIDALGEDSVRLQLRSAQNAFFSPGDTVIDRHLFVQKIQCPNCQTSDIYYQVLLDSQPVAGSIENAIEFSGASNGIYGIKANTGFYGYYTFVPTGYTKGNVQTVFKKM